MAAIITSKFRLNNAEQFVESFSETAATAYYLFIGRSSTWQTDTDVQGNTVNEGTDSSPPTPNDDVSSEFYNYDEMLGLKKVASSDVSQVNLLLVDWPESLPKPFHMQILDYDNERE